MDRLALANLWRELNQHADNLTYFTSTQSRNDDITRHWCAKRGQSWLDMATKSSGLFCLLPSLGSSYKRVCLRTLLCKSKDYRSCREFEDGSTDQASKLQLQLAWCARSAVLKKLLPHKFSITWRSNWKYKLPPRPPWIEIHKIFRIYEVIEGLYKVRN